MADGTEFVMVPVLVGFDHSKVVGELRVLRDALPATPNYCFAIGYRVDACTVSKTPGARIEVTQHELMEVSIQSDEAYAKFLVQEHERKKHG